MNIKTEIILQKLLKIAKQQAVWVERSRILKLKGAGVQRFRNTGRTS
jgi:hypothetical protein